MAKNLHRNKPTHYRERKQRGFIPLSLSIPQTLATRIDNLRRQLKNDVTGIIPSKNFLAIQAIGQYCDRVENNLQEKIGKELAR